MKRSKNYKIGQRIRAIKVEDPYTDIQLGATGTIAFVDDFDTLHVDWDDGHRLGIIPGIDEFEIIDNEEIIAHQTHTLYL